MIPLMEFVEATADANGRATVSKGPNKYGTSWKVTMFATSSTSTTESRLKVYRGFESPGSLLVSTYSGNNDTSAGDNIELGSQESLMFVWENATPGAKCTCRFEGELISARR